MCIPHAKSGTAPHHKHIFKDCVFCPCSSASKADMSDSQFRHLCLHHCQLLSSRSHVFWLWKLPQQVAILRQPEAARRGARVRASASGGHFLSWVFSPFFSVQSERAVFAVTHRTLRYSSDRLSKSR